MALRARSFVFSRRFVSVNLLLTLALTAGCQKTSSPHAPLFSSAEERQSAGANSNLEQERLEDEVAREQPVELVAAEAKGAAAPPAPPAPPALPAVVAPTKRAEKSKLEAASPKSAPGRSFVMQKADSAVAQVQSGAVAPAPAAEPNTERYAHVTEQAFTSAKSNPLSTFSIDVDTASYSNVRRMVNNHLFIEPGAVRVEEMINYFDYDYPEPTAGQPFSVTTEVSHAPWAPEHGLVMIGLQGRHVATTALPPRNLVFLLDVSGSMEDENKLPLLKRSFSKLLDTLNERDRVAIVVYAGASGLVLPSTRASERATIEAALERLSAGGSTNGADGIELAYQVAQQHAITGGINRVILATDGDFNVGPTSESALTALIEAKREQGVSLTVLGFGMGNYNDSTLERLADNGNGNYAYIDTLEEAKKVLVTEASGTMLTIAKDVKIQVEFNPAVVGAYRLIGYDNRRLADRDFNDDRKDAGEIGAGHSVTALYEVLTPAQAQRLAGVDALKYQSVAAKGTTDEMMTVKLRYKAPEGKTSELFKIPVANRTVALEHASSDFRFASAVAAFGMYLRKSEYGGFSSPALALQLGEGALGADPHGYRREFLQLVNSVAGTNRQPVAQGNIED